MNTIIDAEIDVQIEIHNSKTLENPRNIACYLQPCSGPGYRLLLPSQISTWIPCGSIYFGVRYPDEKKTKLTSKVHQIIGIESMLKIMARQAFTLSGPYFVFILSATISLFK